VGQLPDCQAVGNLRVAALGDDLSQVPDWRDIGLPRSSLMASPAVFDGDTLISAPLAGLQNGFSARIVADFTSFLVSR
jgi:tRNA(Ile)-lysidine synthase